MHASALSGPWARSTGDLGVSADAVVNSAGVRRFIICHVCSRELYMRVLVCKAYLGIQQHVCVEYPGCIGRSLLESPAADPDPQLLRKASVTAQHRPVQRAGVRHCLFGTMTDEAARLGQEEHGSARCVRLLQLNHKGS